jgi:hypothetical protein
LTHWPEINPDEIILTSESKDGVLQDSGDGQAGDTSTENTEAAPKGKSASVATEPTEVVTVTLSKNHKTFKTESGDYRLERYKDSKIKAFKDDQVCSNTKNVLRAINKEYKLGFTSGDFNTMHTRKLGKEIIEKMKDSAKELEMSVEPPGEERNAAHAAAVEAPSGTLFSEEEVEEVAETKVKKETEAIEYVLAKSPIPKTKMSLLLLFVSWLPLAYVLYGTGITLTTTIGGLFSVEPLYNGWVVGITWSSLNAFILPSLYLSRR